MNTMNIPVSIGEIIDKISILNVKERRIDDPVAKANVIREKSMVMDICRSNNVEVEPFMDEFEKVNEEIWDVLQLQRDKEKAGELDEDFINISIQVYKLNDKRFELKKKVNSHFGSLLIEEKSYQ